MAAQWSPGNGGAVLDRENVTKNATKILPSLPLLTPLTVQQGKESISSVFSVTPGKFGLQVQYSRDNRLRRISTSVALAAGESIYSG